MRVALLLLLVATSAWAEHRGRFERFCGRTAQGRSNRGFPCDEDAPAFSAFASSGAGVPAACSTSPITGSNGEVFTGSRASSATCSTLGAADTGIQPGTYATLTSNQMRVEPDADGVRGLRIESQRTNRLLRSQEFDDAQWTKLGGAVVTPDGGFAPDNTDSAERFVYDATNDIVLQSDNVAGLASSGSALFRGTSSSGSIDMCRGGGTPQCTVCNYVSTSWTRCSWTATYATANNFFIGCDAPTKGSPCSPAGDVLMWGAESELGGFPTSYIPTTSAQVTRAPDVASFPVTLSGSTFSAAMSFTPLGFTLGATAFEIRVDANNLVRASIAASNTLQCDFIIGGVTSTVTSVATLTTGISNRVSCRYDATGRQACVGGSCVTTAGALTMPTGAATFWWGTRSTTGNEANGILSRGCYDQLSARCG